ncbi:MAG: pyridoxine/pyridoxamine 5'-phosphate oxidase [Melioribacteraceae bacterium]|nr:MAG: pyridoxine/pyridoxamine 5'-phosphate oxidase [Melioribacteraceae bacterium]
MSNNNIENLRKDYSINKLEENNITDDPIKLFSEWLKVAIDSKVNEPTAMTLSTSSEFGYPDSRIVLLKGFDKNGFKFYTNYNSSKGKQLEINPKCALNFFWPELERQVRIKGDVKKVSALESDAYFNSRPKESQLSAIISPQSEKVTNRAYLEKLKDDYKSDNIEIVRPDYWGGYIVIPISIEFWQGRPGRLHDRFLFTRKDEGWERNRLAP